ncbi:hypothetical protein R6Q57_027337 [Mikania cordata]
MKLTIVWVISQKRNMEITNHEGRNLRKVGFYDPVKNQTYLNVPAILYFLEKGAQPTGTVQDILKKTEDFKAICPNQTKFN